MRKWWWSLVLMVALTVPLTGQSGQSEMLTVDNTVGGVRITSAVLQGMAGCSLRLEDAQIRWSMDLSNPPTSTYGQELNPDDTVTLTNITLLRAMRFIRTTGTDGILAVQCWPSS